ncbi:MAG: restriction endonuclease [Bacillota bacterium]|jgi:hypothetical protein
MNWWTQQSVAFARQRNYLDELYKVYPITPNLRRELSDKKIVCIKESFDRRDNVALVSALLDLELFPLKDSYVAYLKRDRTSIERNPETVNRLAGNLYQMGFDMIVERCTEPKETNRQIGPMFKRWVDKGTLGAVVFKDARDFLKCDYNCILNVSDGEMKRFAQEYLGYSRNKGLDFVAKFNRKYVIAEAKFLTDFGGHQNAQFADAVSTMQTSFTHKKVDNEVVPIAVMDGVLYIRGNNKMFRYLKENPDKVIVSALLLREFLYSL